MLAFYNFSYLYPEYCNDQTPNYPDNTDYSIDEIESSTCDFTETPTVDTANETTK